jgi:hypothetical protein
MVSWCPVLQDLAPTEVVFFKDDQIMVLGFGKELPLGEGVLRMNFNGTLNDDLRGFYRRYELFITFNFLDISNKILIMHAENRNA